MSYPYTIFCKCIHPAHSTFLCCRCSWQPQRQACLHYLVWLGGILLGILEGREQHMSRSTDKLQLFSSAIGQGWGWRPVAGDVLGVGCVDKPKAKLGIQSLLFNIILRMVSTAPSGWLISRVFSLLRLIYSCTFPILTIAWWTRWFD